jgi:ribosomal protein S18 acetylase RimI-like enzyme
VSEITIRRAEVADAPEVARLLHDFNTEFSTPTPGIDALSERTAALMADGEITVLLGGERPDGIAVLRFRPSMYSDTLDAHLEELYVAPDRRGRGIGRALLDSAMTTARETGAARMDIGTSEDDTAALGLYESSGFTNLERLPDGPKMLFYERDL